MRGGARIGAGRKPLPYKTMVISIRIPVELHKEISLTIKTIIKRWKQTQTSLPDQQS